jgi:hypothetical protein
MTCEYTVGDESGFYTGDQHTEFVVDTPTVATPFALQNFCWRGMGQSHFAMGSADISFSMAGPGMGMDMLVLDTGKSELGQPGPDVSYSQVSPADFRVTVNGKAPNLLYFSENYNAAWELRAGEDLLEPIDTGFFGIVYEVRTTDRVLNVEFKLQRIYSIGLAFSAAMIVACLALLFVYSEIPKPRKFIQSLLSHFLGMVEREQ